MGWLDDIHNSVGAAVQSNPVTRNISNTFSGNPLGTIAMGGLAPGLAIPALAMGAGPALGLGGQGGSGGASTGNYDGMPTMPAYKNPYDQATMNPVDAYNKEVGAESSGINALRANATTAGDSPWASAAKAENQASQNAALDKGAASVQGAKDTQNAGLAMQGGLSEGARERGAEGANTGFMNMSQGVSQTGSMNNLGIEKQDQQNKLGELNTLTGAEQNQVQGYMNADMANNAGIMANNQGQNSYNMNKYQADANMWGAGKQADATAASAPKGGVFGNGCFITTAMCEKLGKPDDCEELRTLREFRDTFMQATPERKKHVAYYYELATEIEDKLKKIEDVKVWDAIESYILLAVAQIKYGYEAQAYKTYQDLVEFVEAVVADASKV